MLTQDQVFSYLLRQGILHTSQVMESEVVVIDASRRNQNFKVITETGAGYLVKQGIDPEGIATVAHEAAVYRCLQAAGPGHREALQKYLPRCFLYDPSEQLLILEVLRDAEDFREYHARRGRFSVMPAANLGRALAALHLVPRQQVQSAEAEHPWVKDMRPGALSLHHPDIGTMRTVSGGELELVSLLQSSRELCRLLDGLRDDWRADAVVHNDIKWENCLVYSASAGGRRTRIKLVDWEFSCLGDPAWDVGSVFSNYLSFWVSSIPITGEDPLDRYLDIAQYPLVRMQPAMGRFWRSYADCMTLRRSERQDQLSRAVRYAAARLLQTAYERLHQSATLVGDVVGLVQLSLNMLRRPHEAAVLLLGIVPDGEYFG